MPGSALPYRVWGAVSPEGEEMGSQGLKFLLSSWLCDFGTMLDLSVLELSCL